MVVTVEQTTGGVSAGGRRVGRRRNEPDLSTYSGQLAARLRQLRDEHNWSIEELRDKLSLRGLTIPVNSLYAYERGKIGNGMDLPIDYFPQFAAVYGFSSPRTLLPHSPRD